MALGSMSLAASFSSSSPALGGRGAGNPSSGLGNGLNSLLGGLGLGLGLSAGLGMGGPGDGFAGSEGLGDFAGQPLGGLGGGFGNPMMGMGQLGQMNPQAMQAVGALLGLLMGMMGGQGMQGPRMGGPGMGGFPGMGSPPGFPGGCPCGGMGGPQQMGGPGMGGGSGGTIELQKGQSFTTPGGCTINWAGGKEEEVKISEPGGTGRSFGGGNSMNLAASFAGPGFSGALALSASGIGGPLGGACHQAGKDGQPRSWRVWGDPHIDHPNGAKSDFDQKNAMFTLQDGTQVIMGADNPKGIVNRVQVVLPGGRPNWDGLDPAQTSVMKDNGEGKFEKVGNADAMMQGGYGAPGAFPGFGFPGLMAA